MSTTQENQAKFWIKVIVFFVIMFGFGRLPAPEPLTQMGMNTIGVFAAMLFGWCTIGMVWPSIAGILAMPLLGILPLADVFANGWGSTTLLLVFFMMMVAKCLENEGISKFIAMWSISRKVVMGRPWLFAFVFLLAVALVTSLTSAVAMILLGWVIFIDILNEIKAERFWPFANFVMIGIFLAAALGDGLFSFRTVGAVAFVIMEQVSGATLNTALFTLWSFSLLVILLGIYVLLGKYVFRLSTDKLKHLDAQYFATKDISLSKRQKVIMLLMVLLVFLMLFPSVTPADWLINVFLNTITQTGISALIVLLMCLVHVDKKPLMEPISIIQSGVTFDVMFLGAAVLPLATKVFSSEEAGINAFLVQVLSPIVEGKSGVIFLILVALCSVVLTNFMINLTVPTILFPAFYPIAEGIGISPVVLMCIIVYSCFLAYLFPSASPMAAVVFGNKEYIRPKDIYKYAGTFIVLALIVLAVYGIPVANLILA